MGTRADFTVPGGGDFEEIYVGGIRIDTTGASENYHLVYDSSTNSFKPVASDIGELINDVTDEPMGHEDRTASTISFDDSTQTFSISPVSSNYYVWCAGYRFEKTSTETLTIPNSAGLYYIYFDTNGDLQYRTSYFVWNEDCPTAYVYWNGSDGFLFDERHGVTLDWQTHEYLHRTRGAVIANGLLVSEYSSTDESVEVADGTFFDEDLQVDIAHSTSPSSNTWEQQLQGPAQIPVMYRSGTTWVKDTATDYPFKFGTNYPVYNSNSGGSWSTTEFSQNGHGIMWIVATNMLESPVLSIMGQQLYNNVDDAREQTWEDMDFTGLPIVEIRVLAKIIFLTNGTSANMNIEIVEISDYRRAMGDATSSASSVVSHSSLTDLGADDHIHYLLTDGTRTATELTVSGDLTVDTSTLHVDSTNNRVGIGTATPAVDLQISKIGTGSSEPTVRLENLNGNQLDMKVNASEAYVGTPSAIPLNMGTQGQDFVTIGTTGNVSIGNDLTVDTTTLHVDSGSNSVGIGTTSPTAKLDVLGTGHFTGAVIMEGTLSVDDASRFRVDGSNATYIRIGNGFSSSDVLQVDSLGSIDFVIDSNGNSTGKSFQWLTNGDAGTGTVLMALSDTGELTVDGNTVWHAGNDGAGSGLDADTLDSISSGSFLRSDAADTATGAITFTGNVIIDNSTVNTITLYTEQDTSQIADTFADTTTYKSYISFGAGSSSNDPGYIMHETSNSETNEGVLHLCPSDDNSYGDYVSIHGTNDPDKLKFHTDGSIEGVSNLTATGTISASDTIQAPNVRTNDGSYTPSMSNPRWDTSFYVLQSQHWYGHNSSQTMYLGESGNPISLRGTLTAGTNSYFTNLDASYILVNKSGTSSAYTNQHLQLFNPTNNSNSVSGLTFHIAGQLAPVFRSWPGTGAGFDAGNQQGTGYTFLGASSFPVRSSERLKKNIHQKPDEEIIPSVLNALSARTVVFDDNYTDGYWCEEEGCFKEHELCDCEDCEDCNAVRNDPLQRKHFNRRGMIAEELYEVFPEAVHLDKDGIPIGIDYAVLTVELLDAVKLLVLQCENQERRIIELESQ